MNKKALWGLVILASVSAAPGAENGIRFVTQATIPGSSRLVVVAEGDFEPRSAGSYSLRVYGRANPDFPYDDFIAGTVRRRNGTLESVRFPDLDGDGSPDIVVIIRSAGTGSFLSADAFRLSDSTLSLLTSVSDLPKNADPVHALKVNLEKDAGAGAQPPAAKPPR
jgi:hypothetical protein